MLKRRRVQVLFGVWALLGVALAGCSGASDQAEAKQEVDQINLANQEVLSQAPADVVLVADTAWELGADESGNQVFKTKYTKRARGFIDQVHEQMQSQGWSAGIVTEQPNGFFMQYTKEPKEVIYELSRYETDPIQITVTVYDNTQAK